MLLKVPDILSFSLYIMPNSLEILFHNQGNLFILLGTPHSWVFSCSGQLWKKIRNFECKPTTLCKLIIPFAKFAHWKPYEVVKIFCSIKHMKRVCKGNTRLCWEGSWAVYRSQSLQTWVEKHLVDKSVTVGIMSLSVFVSHHM